MFVKVSILSVSSGLMVGSEGSRIILVCIRWYVDDAAVAVSTVES